MKRRWIVVIVLGASRATARGRVSRDLEGGVPETFGAVVPDAVRGPASWAWKILAAAVVACGAAGLLAHRRHGAAVGRGVPADGAAPAAAAPPDGVAAAGHGAVRIGAAVPALPAPHLVHPCAPGDHFGWRAAERQVLSEWYKGRTQPVCALVGGSGVGKSALAWVWLNRDVLGQDAPQAVADPPDVADACRLSPRSRPRGAMWWPFDQPGGGFAPFLDEALRYVSNGAIRPQEYLSSPAQKLESLLGLLEAERFLLVLDGFERELWAYASIRAPYQGDDFAEGPRGEHRACSSPQAAEFLRRLIERPVKSRVLITGRLLPRELADRDTGEPAEACLQRLLVGLPADDAMAFLQAEGIGGRPEALRDACNALRGHGLSLRVLAGLLRSTGKAAVLRDAAKLLPPRVVDEDLGAFRHLMERAWQSMPRRSQRALGRLAALRHAATVAELRQADPAADAPALEAALRELVTRGIATLDTGPGRYHLHPLVRADAYERLRDWREVHDRLAARWPQDPVPGQVACVEALLPGVERYCDLVGAERFDEAYALLTQRLSTPLTHRFAEYPLYARLLAGLFADGGRKPPRLASRSDQAWAIDAFAASCSYSGQTRRAAAVCESNLGAFPARSAEHAILLGRLAGLEARLGLLRRAEEHLRRVVTLQGQLADPRGEAIARCRLGLLLASRGVFPEAMAELDRAFVIIEQSGDHAMQSVVFAYCAQRALLMGDTESALEAAGRARASVEKTARQAGSDEHDFVRSGLLMAGALVAAAEGGAADAPSGLAEAERYLSDAISRCRRGNLVAFEPDLLLTSARWHRLKGDRGRAVRLAGEALVVADRCDYRLRQAEAHAMLARLEAEGGDRAAACRHAEAAMERAWCDGPPFCGRPILDEVEKVLGLLGAAAAPAGAGALAA